MTCDSRVENCDSNPEHVNESTSLSCTLHLLLRDPVWWSDAGPCGEAPATLYHKGLSTFLPPTPSHSQNFSSHTRLTPQNISPSWYSTCGPLIPAPRTHFLRFVDIFPSVCSCVITERISGSSFWQCGGDSADCMAGIKSRVLGEERRLCIYTNNPLYSFHWQGKNSIKVHGDGLIYLSTSFSRPFFAQNSMWR